MPASINNEFFRNLLFSWPEKALALLYQEYYHKLIRVADMHTHNRQASEDVLQEVFADIWQKHKILGRLRNQSIQTYLIKAIEYHSITSYKRNSKKGERERQYFYDTAGSALEYPAEAAIISKEKHTFIRLVIGTLPPREKECLLLQIDYRMSVADIARRLGISKKAVERNLTSAKKRLRKFRWKG
jgi:RNA polymerase sigma factor (sigma-70 family)